MPRRSPLSWYAEDRSMIGPATQSKTLILTGLVDFRKGKDGLAPLVKCELGGEPFSAIVYVYRAKKADHIQLVQWDGTDLCLLSKRRENALKLVCRARRRHVTDIGHGSPVLDHCNNAEMLRIATTVRLRQQYEVSD